MDFLTPVIVPDRLDEHKISARDFKMALP